MAKIRTALFSDSFSPAIAGGPDSIFRLWNPRHNKEQLHA